MSTRSVKLVAMGVGVVAIGLGVAVACAQAQPARPAARGGEPIPETTVVVLDAKARTVTPQIGLLRQKSTVKLQVKSLAPGQTLEIDFRVQGTPSVKGPPPMARSPRGRSTRPGGPLGSTTWSCGRRTTLTTSGWSIRWSSWWISRYFSKRRTAGSSRTSRMSGFVRRSSTEPPSRAFRVLRTASARSPQIA